MPSSSKYKDPFNYESERSVYWYNRASDLRAGALVLWHAKEQDGNPEFKEEVGYSPGFSFKAALPPPTALLMGLAIELFLKACLVKREGRLVKKHAHHDLCMLADAASLSLKKEERVFLEILTHYITWLGRYPVPNKPEQYEATIRILHKGRKLVKASIPISAPDESVQPTRKNLNLFWAKIAEHYREVESKTLT